MAINLNHVKSIKKGNTELKDLTIGETLVWKKIDASISVSNITSGKRITFSKTSGDPLLHNTYTKTHDTDTYSTTKTTYDVTSVDSGTAGIIVGIDVDHPIASANQAWSVTRASASISVTNATGGKKITITNNVGSGTLHYLFSGSSWSTTTDTSVSYTCTSTSSGTAQAYVTGASGYADASASTGCASQAWSVSTASAPTISSTNYLSGTTGGKTFTITNNMSSGTLQYKIGSGSWTNYSSAFTVTSANTIYARVVNVTGYSDSGNATDSVTACTAPTISVTNIAGGKTISISVPSGTAGIVYNYNGTPNTTSTSAVSTNKTTVSSGTAQAYAYKSGYANASASQAWSVTQLSAPSIAITNISGGKRISISKSTNATGIVYNYNGTPSTTSTSNVSTNVTSAQSGTARAYAYADGYVSSSTAEQSWSVTQLAAPTISVTNITSGKRISISKSTNATGIVYNYNGDPSTTSTSNVSIDKTSVSSGTAKAYAYADGYVSSSTASQAWSVTTATASIGISNITSGKKVTITNNAGSGTLHYLYSGSSYTDTASTSVNSSYTSVTSGTAKAYVTGASGYADGSSSGAASQAWSVTKAPASISVGGVSGGKKITITNTAGSGTLYYLYSGSTYSNTTSSSVNNSYTSVTSGTAKAYVTGASGYADASASSLSVSQDWSVTQLSAPTITVSNITSGKKISINIPSNATGIYYDYDTSGTPATNSTSAVSTNKTSVSSGTAKAYAYASTGYVSSSTASQAWSVTKAPATISVTNITGGKRISFSNTAGSGTMYYRKSTSDNFVTTGSPFDITTVSSGTAQVYVTGASGYADASTSSLSASQAWSVTLAPASINVTNTTGGKIITITNTAGSGTLYYRKYASGNFVTSGSPFTVTSVDSGTAQAYVTGASGYANASSSNLSASQAWSVTQLGAPTITVSNITSGKRIAISKSTNATGIVYNYNGTPDTTSTSNVSTDKTSVSSGTAKAYAYAQGYVSSTTAEQAWSVTAAPASISVSNIDGGKKVTITNNAGSGTLYYLYSGSSYSSTTNTSVNNSYTSVTSGTAKAYVTGASGYADGSSSSPASQAWSVTQLTAPTISVTNITGGKTVGFSQGSQGGTLYYLYSGSSYSSTSSNSISDNKTTASSGTAKAYVTKAGYVTSDTASQAWSVTAATMTASVYTSDPYTVSGVDPITGRKQYKFTSSAGGTIKIGIDSSYKSGVGSSAYYRCLHSEPIYWEITDASGYANSSGTWTSASVTQTEVTTARQAATIITSNEDKNILGVHLDTDSNNNLVIASGTTTWPDFIELADTVTNYTSSSLSSVKSLNNVDEYNYKYPFTSSSTTDTMNIGFLKGREASVFALDDGLDGNIDLE